MQHRASASVSQPFSLRDTLKSTKKLRDTLKSIYNGNIPKFPQNFLIFCIQLWFFRNFEVEKQIEKHWSRGINKILSHSRKHSVYPYCGRSHLPSSLQTRRRSPFKKKPSLHSNVTIAPGVNWKLDLRPKRGVSKIPQDKIRLKFIC